MTNRATYDVEVGLMSEQEAVQVLDGITRRELDISGPEFLRRWDAGDYRETDWTVPDLVDTGRSCR